MARYELGERIGLGGMAEIFRGKATAGGGFEKPVAIKRILPHLSQDKRFVEALITEAKTLSQLRHRNVVQIYDVGLGDDGQYFLVMEFVDGLDLNRLYESLEQRARRLPLEVALYVTGEVCEALEHAHHARGENGQPLGLVHRDVSPSNVLLSKSGEVKLTDFGIAKRTEEATGHGGVRGKFAYISPEQAHNKRVDARSDVFSVGILLFELLTGRRLFSGLPDFEALRAVREGRLPRPRDIDPGIDAELERILLSALAPRPEDRPQSAGDLGAQLRTCRYSMVSSVADPAIEIARLVEEHTGNAEGRAPAREPSVVRISTVAGFSGSFDVPAIPEELTARSVSGELTGPAGLPGLDDDEATRAVELDDDFGAKGHRIDLEKYIQRERREREERGDPDPADAETRVLDFRPGELFPELAGTGHAVEAVSHHESAGPISIGGNGPGRSSTGRSPLPPPRGLPPPRTSPAIAPRTPSPRQQVPGRVSGSPAPAGMLGASSSGGAAALAPTLLAPPPASLAGAPLGPGALGAPHRPPPPPMNGPGPALGSHAPLSGPGDALGGALYTGSDESREPSPMAPAGPILDSRGSFVRRHAVPLAIGSALGLALLSFIVVGAFMKGNEKNGQTAKATTTGPDAGVAAGATPGSKGDDPAPDPTPTTPPGATAPVPGVTAAIDAGGVPPAGSPGSETQPTPPDSAPPPDRTTDRKTDRTSGKQSARTGKRKKKKTTKKRTTKSSDRRRGSRSR